MLKIIDEKVYNEENQKIGWIEGNHIKDAGNNVIGFAGTEHVYDRHNNKIAYIENGKLNFENGRPGIPLEQIQEKVHGDGYAIPLKCAIHVLFED